MQDKIVNGAFNNGFKIRPMGIYVSTRCERVEMMVEIETFVVERE